MNFTQPNLPAVVEDGVFENVPELDQDFKLARDNLRDLAEISQEAMIEFARITKQMQDPRAYGTLAKLLTASILAQKAVVEVHKNKVEGKDGEEKDSPIQHVTHNTLVMTTDQMLAMLEERKK